MNTLTPKSRASRKATYDTTFVEKMSKVAAILFIVGGILSIIVHVIEKTSHEKYSYKDYIKLDSALLYDIWKTRREYLGWELIVDLVELIAWFTVSIPVSLFAERFGRHDSKGKVLQAIFIIIAMFETMDMTMTAGSVSTADWIASWPPLANKETVSNHTNDGGFGAIQSLEISYRMSQSRRVWLNAIDSLFLCCGFYIMGKLIKHHAVYLNNTRLGIYCLFLSIVTMVEFLISGLRYANWRVFMILEIIIQLVIRLILFPIWLWWLSKLISDTHFVFGNNDDSSNMMLNGSNNGNNRSSELREIDLEEMEEGDEL